MPETILDGRYTLLDAIGLGALSKVFLARDRDGALAVAKRLHRHLAHDATCRAMAEHEARLLGAMDHPNIPRLFAYGDDPGGWCVVLERVEGVGLDAPRPRVPWPAAAEAVRQLLGTLSYVHQLAAQGAPLAVVHRDVSPANLLVTREGRVALVDFGIATSRWRVDPDRGVMKGTRGYMAPEVVTGARDADARADLFAAGVILTELFTGRRVYEGPAPKVFDAIVEGPVVAPRTLDPSVPHPLDEVAARAMQKSPEDRYSSAGEFLDALEAALSRAGVTPSKEALGALSR